MAEDKESESSSLSVDDALKMYGDYKSHWDENYREANIDLKMASGDPQTHYGMGWDDKYTKLPSAAVVDNELPQYIHQVTNDIRQNVPSIKVLPVSDGDIETGEVFRGLFRSIEDHSHADEVCDTAAEYAVTCSIGFMRIDHDYCDDESDEQEIIFKTVPDPLSVWLDPASVEFDGRDANGAIALEPISRKDFERLYKGKKFSSFTAPKDDSTGKDSIVLAEIFIREVSGARGKKYTVRRYRVSGDEILNETTFPGKYIPIVPIYGEVKWIDGKRVLSSLIRQARSPQRRLNHMLSKESQLLAQAPIAPIMAAEGTLVNERKQWQIPGLENALEYRQTDLEGNPAPQPTRLQPPGASTGFLEAIASAKEAIKASMGIYNAGLGKREGNASGIALEQLDRSGDVATFHYPDNVRRSYGHMGEIAVDMTPIIYDTPRIVQTLNDEADVVMVGINGAPAQDGQKQPYDLRKGKYRVRITTGASYTTKRQEEAAFLSQIAQKDPNFMQVGGDILFKSMDTPGSQALAARYKKLIPPQLLEESEQPQVPPEMQQKMQQMEQIIQQGAQEIQSLQAQLDNKQGEQQIKQGELQIKAKELEIKQAELQIKAAELQAPQTQDNGDDAFERAIKERELQVKEYDAETKRIQAMQKEPEQPGIKLDTTGFHYAKTPEQEDEDAMKIEQESAMEAEELRLKQVDIEQRAQQGQALIGTLDAIASRLDILATKASEPINVIRDQNGVIVGAN